MLNSFSTNGMAPFVLSWLQVDDDLDQMVGQHLLSLKDLDQDEQ